MKIKICIGSSCHIRGSEIVVKTFQQLAQSCGKDTEMELSGSFCMGACSPGVSVKVDEELYHVKPEEAEDFFRRIILKEA